MQSKNHFNQLLFYLVLAFFSSCNEQKCRLESDIFNPDFDVDINRLERKGYIWVRGIDVLTYEKDINDTISMLYYFDDIPESKKPKVESVGWQINITDRDYLKKFLSKHNLVFIDKCNVINGRNHLYHKDNRLVYFLTIEKMDEGNYAFIWLQKPCYFHKESE